MMEQGSPEWHAWRLSGIGASDIPVIMGVSPYKTRHQLWIEKTGKAPAQEAGFAARRGQRLEEDARRLTSSKLGWEYQPSCETASGAGNEWKHASFDGVNLLGTSAIEIKCPSKAEHEATLAGEITPKYLPQLDWQWHVLTCDASNEKVDSCCLHFVSYHPDFHEDQRLAIVQYIPDNTRIAQVVEEAEKFWQMVQDGVEPEQVAADEKRTEFERTDEAWLIAANEYRKAKQESDKLGKKVEEIGKRLKAMAITDKDFGGGVSVAIVSKSGGIDYAAWLADNPDLTKEAEKYRKKDTTTKAITISKGSEP